MKFATVISWYLVRNLREADPELDREKLKRTLLDGSLLPPSLDTTSDTSKGHRINMVAIGFPTSKMDNISLCGEHLPYGNCVEVQKTKGNILTKLDCQPALFDMRKKFLAPTLGMVFAACDDAYNYYIYYAMEEEFCVWVRGSWLQQNSRESSPHQFENSMRNYNPIHYRESIFHTKVFKEYYMIDNNGNSFEISLRNW